MSTIEHRVELPEDFDRHAREIEAKGCLVDVQVSVGDRRYLLTFCDPLSLAETIEEALRTSAVFFESNLVVVPSVTRAHMEAAIDILVASGAHDRMVEVRGSRTGAVGAE